MTYYDSNNIELLLHFWCLLTDFKLQCSPSFWFHLWASWWESLGAPSLGAGQALDHAWEPPPGPSLNHNATPEPASFPRFHKPSVDSLGGHPALPRKRPCMSHEPFQSLSQLGMGRGRSYSYYTLLFDTAKWKLYNICIHWYLNKVMTTDVKYSTWILEGNRNGRSLLTFKDGLRVFTGGPVVKDLPADAEDRSSVPGPGRFNRLQSN